MDTRIDDFASFVILLHSYIDYRYGRSFIGSHMRRVCWTLFTTSIFPSVRPSLVRPSVRQWSIRRPGIRFQCSEVQVKIVDKILPKLWQLIHWWCLKCYVYALLTACPMSHKNVWRMHKSPQYHYVRWSPQYHYVIILRHENKLQQHGQEHPDSVPEEHSYSKQGCESG